MRRLVEGRAEQLGVNVMGAVTRSTTFVVVGSVVCAPLRCAGLSSGQVNGGRKKEDLAETYGIPLIPEDEWDDIAAAAAAYHTTHPPAKRAAAQHDDSNSDDAQAGAFSPRPSRSTTPGKAQAGTGKACCRHRQRARLRRARGGHASGCCARSARPGAAQDPGRRTGHRLQIDRWRRRVQV